MPYEERVWRSGITRERLKRLAKVKRGIEGMEPIEIVKGSDGCFGLMASETFEIGAATGAWTREEAPRRAIAVGEEVRARLVRALTMPAHLEQGVGTEGHDGIRIGVRGGEHVWIEETTVAGGAIGAILDELAAPVRREEMRRRRGVWMEIAHEWWEQVERHGGYLRGGWEERVPRTTRYRVFASGAVERRIEGRWRRVRLIEGRHAIDVIEGMIASPWIVTARSEGLERIVVVMHDGATRRRFGQRLDRIYPLRVAERIE